MVSRPTASLRRVAPLWVALAMAGVTGMLGLVPSSAHASASPHYTTRGIVRSFGPNRAYIVIAHEKIEGYMEAMTMSFEPRSPGQLEGLGAGDKVTFTFSDADGHRLLDTIKRM